MTTATVKNGQRLLPHDLDAEEAVLGSLLIDVDELYETAAIIQPRSFYRKANGDIFQAISNLTARGEAADVITIAAELRANGIHDIGESQLVNLLQRPVTSLNASTYARIVADTYTRRQVIAASQKLATMAWDDSEDIHDINEQAQGLIFEAMKERGRGGTEHISTVISRYIDDIERRFENPQDIPGLATGLDDLDRMTLGLKPGRLYVVAGRPGMGKTGLMISMANYMTINQSKRGIVFSMEMTKSELIERLIASRINVDTGNLESGNLTPNQKAKFYEESGKAAQFPLWLNKMSDMTPAKIRAECIKQQMATGLDYVVIDYLQLVKIQGSRSRYEQVSEAARAFKNLAMELDCPVILASQLNRAVEARGDKRPGLADLRDSGEIEEAADVVILLYRDEYYNEGASEYPNILEVNVAKNRKGKTGRVDMFWRAYTTSAHNLQTKAINL